jgi:hypothetical protein
LLQTAKAKFCLRAVSNADRQVAIDRSQKPHALPKKSVFEIVQTVCCEIAKNCTPNRVQQVSKKHWNIQL